MQDTKTIIATAAIIATLLLTLLLVKTTMYQVDQKEYALELRFGQVRNVRLQPGLYLKTPFIDMEQPISQRRWS